MLDKKPLKVLVADDDDAIRLAIVSVIQSEGFSVIEADNGDTALEMYERERPDIVLLDTIMPEKNGYEVCQSIRNQSPDIHELPILMITVMDGPDSIEKAQEAGASDYLTKPIHWPLLMYRLNMLFAEKQHLRERTKVEDRLRQAHKLSAIRQLTGGFAHDFNNILASQLGYTELALNYCDNVNEDKLKSYLGEVQKASLRGKILIEQLMSYAMDEMDLTEVSAIKDVFIESTKSLSKTVPARINFETHVELDNGWIPLDFIQFHEIMMNLLENAVDAIEGEGSISMTLERRHIDKQICASCLEEYFGEYLVLSVKDSGPGIVNEILPRIFEPFYTTKPVGKGTGHGMSVIHGIVHAAGGHIHVDSGQVGKGCTIEICFAPIDSAQQKVV